MISLTRSLPTILAFSFLTAAFVHPDTALSQSTRDPVWGLYAVGLGKRVTDPMIRPCDIGYQVRLMAEPDVTWGVAHGVLVPIYENVTRRTAEAGLHRFGHFHDDEPDGVVKMTSCEASRQDDDASEVDEDQCVTQPLTGHYEFNTSWVATMKLTQVDTRVTGTYGPNGENTINGVLECNVLAGYYRNTVTDANGVFELTFSGDQVTGWWERTHPSEGSGRWGTGRRIR